MRHFTYVDGRLHCEGVPLAAIAAEVGTPVYVYSRATLERHYRVFKEAFAPRDPLVAFAVKANGNIAVIATLAALGAGADVVSGGEIERALAGGVPPGRIIFSGVGKTREELDYALSLGLHQINVESPAELAMLEEAAAAAKARPALAIRVNPGVGAGGHDKITTGRDGDKFGVSLAEAEALYARAAASPHLEPVGLAVHIGSQITDLGPAEAAFRLLRGAAERLRTEGFPLTRLDLGGGLGVPYEEGRDPPGPKDYAAMVERVFQGFDVALAFEPGRLIAANAGALLTRVIREQPRADRRILVVDAAMNDLLRPALYDARHEVRAEQAPPPGGPTETVDLVGPVCESADTFAKAIPLPRLEAGDLLALMTAGAYSASMASTYNARPLVPEVLVDGDKWSVVRRRASVQEQIRLESVPEWLKVTNPAR